MVITTRKLAISALLLTADIILTRLIAFNTPVMKIGLGFTAVALCAMIYGPWWTALVAAMGDLLGSLLFPTGAYFPGFTLTAACTGLIFGLCLYRRDLHWYRPVLAAALNTLLISYTANTLIICFISGAPVKAMFAARLVQLAVMLPLQIVVLTWLMRSDFVRKVLEQIQ